MKRDYATAMNSHMAEIIAQITRAIALAQSKADPEDYAAVQKALGLLIGMIDMDILWPIYRTFPDLDPFDGPIPPA